MQCAYDIDTKNSLDKPQDDGPHDDNRDISEDKEEDASNHNIILSPEIIQNFWISQVLMLATPKVSLKSSYETIWQDAIIFQRALSDA